VRIKNWKKFQHFKDRRPPWIKLYRDLLDDKEWHDLDPKAAKLLVMLWLIASESDNGELPAVDVIAFRIRIDIKACTTLLSQLSHWLDIDAISSGYQDDPSETEEEIEKEREVESPAGQDTDESFWDELAKLYTWANLPQEKAKMQAWLLTPRGRGRKITRRFVVNWLNKLDKPISGIGANHGSTGLINTWHSGGDESMMQQAREAGFT
jgi:hypothetical protein